MLINSAEIYNLAFLDSQYFDKEGFLLVKEHPSTQQLNYVERFIRLKGNLLFILSIPNGDELFDHVKSEFETDECRIKALISFYQTNRTLDNDHRNLLSVIVLTSEFSLRKFDETAKDCGFAIEFHHIVDNIWKFTCLTVEERDQWIHRIDRANYANLKSIFNLLLERKLNLIVKQLTNSTYSTTQPNAQGKSNSSNDLNKSSSTNQSTNSVTSTASSLSIVSSTSTNSINLSLLSRFSTATSLNAQNNLIQRQKCLNSSKDGFKSIFLTDSYFKHRTSLEQLTASYSFTLTCDFNEYRKSINFPANIFIKVYCSLIDGHHWSTLGRTETLKISGQKVSKFAKKFYLNLYEKIELQNNLNKIVKFDFENNRILLKFNVYNLIEPYTEQYILIGSAIDYFKPDFEIEIFSSIHYKPLQIGLIKMTTLDNNEFNIFNQNQNDTTNCIKSSSNGKYSTAERNEIKPMFEFGAWLEPQLFVNTIHRSFKFSFDSSSSDIDQPPTIININELMSEPVLIFNLVNDLMGIFMDDEKKLMNCITYSLGEVKPEYQRRQMQMLETHLRLVNCITESINSLNQVQTGTKFFRQSIQKQEIFFQFVPLNLHLQRTIFNKQSNRKSDRKNISSLNQNNCESFDILNIYTHGCFAAHRLGFENGGLSKFMNEIENSTKETNYFHLNQIWSAMLNYFKIVNLSKQVTDLNDKMINLTLKLGKQTDLKLAKRNEFCDDFQRLQIDLQNEAKQQLFRDKIYCQKVILKLFNEIEECCLKMTSVLDPKQVDLTLGFLDVFRFQQTFNNATLEEDVTLDTKVNEDKISNSKSSMLSTMKSSLNSTIKFNLMNSTKSNNSNFKSNNKQYNKQTIKSGMERTISCPLDQVQSSHEMMQKTENRLKKLRRHNSDNRIDDHLEFEPVDLIHLNIKASLISIRSKLNQLINFNLESYQQQKFNYSSLYEKIVNEMKPSTKKLFTSIENLVKTSSICHALESLKLSKDQSEYFYLIRSRRNMCFAQAVTAFSLALLGELTCPTKIDRSEYLDNLHNLSNFNNNDLGDLNDLSKFNDDSSYLNRLFEQKQIICYFESLLSCYGEEIGMLQDVQWAIQELNSVEVVFCNLYYDAGQFKKYNLSDNLLSNDKLLNNGVFNMPKFEGNGYNLKIKIPIYDESLPDEFKCEIVGLLFNIGINESATLAETLGHVKLQEEINQKSFLNLENFVTLHADIKNKNLINNLTALKTEIYSKRAKNVRILQLAEQIAYDLNAIRFTNCKSGKDRTAMACTLECVRKCGSMFNFNEISNSKFFQQILDAIRGEGTRRENTRKNIGVNKYAFNSLRVITLPKNYRPPAGSYSKNIQT